MTARYTPEIRTYELTEKVKNTYYIKTELKSEFPYIIQPVWKQAVEGEGFELMAQGCLVLFLSPTVLLVQPCLYWLKSHLCDVKIHPYIISNEKSKMQSWKGKVVCSFSAYYQPLTVSQHPHRTHCNLWELHIFLISLSFHLPAHAVC